MENIVWTKQKSSIRIKWFRKIKSIEYLGGSCKMCGDENPLHLSFHHIDSKNKSSTISSILKGSYEKLVKELDKCILLCNNCHREHHYIENIKLGDTEQRRHNKYLFLEYMGHKCSDCGYDKCVSSLTFHHLISESKKFNIASNGKVFKNVLEINKEIKNELDKCVVLCSNCHFEKRIDREVYNYVISNISNIKIKKISCKIDRKVVYDLYFNKKMNQSEICKKFNYNKTTISKIVKKLTKNGSLV